MKNTHGGKRPGAGAKKRINYETETIHKRVRKGYKSPLLKLIDEKIKLFDSQ